MSEMHSTMSPTVAPERTHDGLNRPGRAAPVARKAPRGFAGVLPGRAAATLWASGRCVPLPPGFGWPSCPCIARQDQRPRRTAHRRTRWPASPGAGLLSSRVRHGRGINHQYYYHYHYHYHYHNHHRRHHHHHHRRRRHHHHHHHRHHYYNHSCHYCHQYIIISISDMCMCMCIPYSVDISTGVDVCIQICGCTWIV